MTGSGKDPRVLRLRAAAECSEKLFKTKQDWAAWLDRNHRESAGVWLQIEKKGSTVRSVTYSEAVDVALCYGWVDGQKKPKDQQLWLQKFLPRSKRSLWSKINREKVLGLIESGDIKPAGLEAIAQAKESGRWDAAYDSPRKAEVPADLQAALDASPTAKAFFETLDKVNRYAVLWRIQTVKKTETRIRKIKHFTKMMDRREKIH